MPKQTTRRRAPGPTYWQKRIASPAFARGLAETIAAELRRLAPQRVGDVVDPASVRTLIRAWDTRLVNRALLAELGLAAHRRGAKRLRGKRQAPLALFDPALLEELDAALAAALELSPRAEAFVAALMGREFVRSLFTDLIFTAIVAFQRKLNPLFGALTARALEDQIKGFIRLFMPMLQAQATAFIVDRRNQRVVLDLARAVVRQLLERPLDRYAALASAGGSAAEGLLRAAAADEKLGELVRHIAVAVWDDLFAVARARRLGELLHLDAQADWLAARAVELILPLLSSAGVLSFISAEVERKP